MAEVEAIIELRNVGKTFFRGKEPVEVLSNLNLDVPTGSFEALMGPSGSGKSTLLNLIAGLDQPTTGTARVAGEDITKMSDAQLASFRSRTMAVFHRGSGLGVRAVREVVSQPPLGRWVYQRRTRARRDDSSRVTTLPWSSSSDHTSIVPALPVTNQRAARFS